MYSLRKINDFEVKRIKPKKADDRPWKCKDLFSNGISNIYLLAKKNSGKTTTLFNIVKESVGPDTKVIIFSSTYNKDTSMIAIREWLEEKNIVTTCYFDIVEDGVELLPILMDEMKADVDPPAEEEEEEDDGDQWLVELGHIPAVKKKETKKKEAKERTPKYIIIMDDLAQSLRNRWCAILARQNRHYQCMFISSSQYLNDLSPSHLKNLDYILCWPGQSEDKFELIYKHIGLHIDIQLLWKIYLESTAEKYNFLYIDTTQGRFRKNFNQQFILE